MDKGCVSCDLCHSFILVEDAAADLLPLGNDVSGQSDMIYA
jgi:hypothetical protein